MNYLCPRERRHPVGEEEPLVDHDAVTQHGEGEGSRHKIHKPERHATSSDGIHSKLQVRLHLCFFLSCFGASADTAKESRLRRGRHFTRAALNNNQGEIHSFFTLVFRT